MRQILTTKGIVSASHLRRRCLFLCSFAFVDHRPLICQFATYFSKHNDRFC